jgi:sporulation protein YlmC with PRC-barrel domain
MVHINLDAEKFEAMPDYAEAAYLAPITDYVAPPSLQDRGSTGAGFQVDVMLAVGDKGFAMDKPTGYPGGEQTVPTDMQIAVVTQGSPVLDVDGKAVGEIGEMGVDDKSGGLTRIVVRRARIVGNTIEIPSNWVERVTPSGVLLNVSERQLDVL